MSIRNANAYEDIRAQFNKEYDKQMMNFFPEVSTKQKLHRVASEVLKSHFFCLKNGQFHFELSPSCHFLLLLFYEDDSFISYDGSPMEGIYILIDLTKMLLRATCSYVHDYHWYPRLEFSHGVAHRHHLVVKKSASESDVLYIELISNIEYVNQLLCATLLDFQTIQLIVDYTIELDTKIKELRS